MGMMSAACQEKAARYLVNVLEEKGGKVHYSEFYDGTVETTRRLNAGMGIDEGEGELAAAASAMDLAAAAMEAQGFVKLISHQGEKLVDGEPAYSIELTDKGRKKLAAGKFPKFRNLCL